MSEALPAGAGDFPTATLLVNLVGALAIGVYLARREQPGASRQSLRFWAIGVLGSFTTFSAFSLEVVELLDVDRAAVAGLYVAGSLVGGFVAALAGDRIGELVR